MFSYRSVFSVVAVTLALGASGAMAQSLPGSLAKMDKNGDGRLSLEEWQADKPKSFQKLDANKDGSVTREEALAYYTKIVKPTDPKTPALRTDTLFKQDANGDGTLTLEESLAAGEAAFKGRDKDGDGFLTGADEKKK